MNPIKFFIVCEINPNTPNNEYVTLERWNLEKEEAHWSGEYIDIAKNIGSAVHSIIELCGSGRWDTPYYFETLEEAKSAALIVAAHDEPKKDMTFKYHIITCRTITIPGSIVEIQ